MSKELIIPTIIVPIASVVFSAIVAYLVARIFGDMAAAKETRKYQEIDRLQAQRLTVRSLINEVAMARKAVEHNQVAIPAPENVIDAVPLATSSFETAFFSPSHGIPVSDELLDDVTDYLSLAHGVNSLIQGHFFVASSDTGLADTTREKLRNRAQSSLDKAPAILDRLDKQLRNLQNTLS